MSREYFISDAMGERQLSEADLPFRIGGKGQQGIVLPDVSDDRLFAFIALSDGHAYIQPAGENTKLFHNDDRLTESAWLKSGDRIQINDATLSWQVQGDRVQVSVLTEPGILPVNQQHQPLPPKQRINEFSHAVDEGLPVAPAAEHAGHLRSHGSRKAFGLFIGLLLLIAIFLLVATPVVIKTMPEDASVSMKGFPPPLSLLESRLALPGQYIIEASYPGYFPLTETVKIEMGDMTDLSYEMTELPGILLIKTTPEVPLSLTVDGVKMEVAENNRAEISRGSHRLLIESDRYLPVEVDVEIKGFGEEQPLMLELLPAWAEVELSTEPEKAEVLIDGESVGTTPLKTEVLRGSHEILLQKEGFKNVSIRQTIEAGKNVSLTAIKLQPVDGQLELKSVPGGASTLIDGSYAGTTPISINLSANAEHTVKLSKAGYITVQQVVRLGPDEEKLLSLKLTAEYGTVFLSTRPAGVSVFIDGKKISKTNGLLRLSARPHTLTIRKTGYVTESMRIRPRVGSSQSVNVELKTTAQLKSKKKSGNRQPENSALTSPGGQKMYLIAPAETLKMGASRREAGRRANESQRLVKLQRPFYFAGREVTNAEFRKFKPPHDSGNFDGAALNGEDQPVVNISWDDAARYSNWLSKKQGLPVAYEEKGGKMFAVSPMTTGYRLTTEAEWAWVARRQGRKTEKRYPWPGSFPPRGKAGNFADARIADTLADVVPGYDDNFRGSAPVGSFPAWPKGFYDLGGNVAEWMHDYYAVYPGESSKVVTDPSGPATGKHHVVRGASWRHGNITELRLSYRDYSSKPRYDLGFRLARYAR